MKRQAPNIKLIFWQTPHVLSSSMAVIPLDMGAFPTLIRPLRDHIRCCFGNWSVLWDLIRVLVSVVWLPVFAILNEYQAREDHNRWECPKCSFEYTSPPSLGVGFVSVEDCKNEDSRGTENEEGRDQDHDVGYYLGTPCQFLYRIPFFVLRRRPLPGTIGNDLHDWSSFASRPSKQRK